MSDWPKGILLDVVVVAQDLVMILSRFLSYCQMTQEKCGQRSSLRTRR